MTSVRKIASSRPQAAKEHLCGVCGWPIAIGEQHERLVFIDHGHLDKPRIVTVRMHINSGCPRELRCD